MTKKINTEIFQAVEFSKNQLEAIFDHLEPMCLINQDLRVKRLNKAMSSFLSKTYKECLNSPLKKVFQEWDYSLLISNVNLVFSYRRSIQVNDYTIVEKGKKGWYEITFYPVVNGEENIEECVIYFKNVTELFLTKKILYQQYKKLEEQQMTVENQHIKLLETKNALNKMYQALKEELNVAREVQEGIMPRELPKFKGVDFYSSYQPISQVGGDIYDILELSPTKIGIFIGDVSGHGLPAAFVAAMVKMALIDHAKDNVSPKELFSVINKSLFQNLKSGHYLTAFYGVLNLMTKELTYGKASHPQPLLIRKEGKVIELETEGMFLGLLEEPQYEEKIIQLEKGDKIYFFTDGYFEIQGETGNRFIYQEFSELLKKLNTLPLKKMHSELLNELKIITGENELEDDRTFLSLEITEDKKSEIFPPKEYFSDSSNVVMRNFSSEKEYHQIFEEMEKYLMKTIGSRELVDQINVCALELANNAIEHGHKWDKQKKILVAYTASENRVKISFMDQGGGFDLNKTLEFYHNEKIDRERGRGLQIVQSLMDQVYYNELGNGVTIVKNISQ